MSVENGMTFVPMVAGKSNWIELELMQKWMLVTVKMLNNHAGNWGPDVYRNNYEADYGSSDSGKSVGW